VTGERQLYPGTIDGVVEVGPENPEVEFMEGLASVNVGMALLRKFAITLDPEEQRVWLAERK